MKAEIEELWWRMKRREFKIWAAENLLLVKVLFEAWTMKVCFHAIFEGWEQRLLWGSKGREFQTVQQRSRIISLCLYLCFSLSLCVCVCVCVSLSMYLCMCVYIYIYLVSILFNLIVGHISYVVDWFILSRNSVMHHIFKKQWF